MADLKKLRADAAEAEDAAHKLQAEKDDALQKVRDRYGKRLRAAVDKAAAAQKAAADAEAAQALADRDDLDDEQKRTLAGNLGLTLP